MKNQDKTNCIMKNKDKTHLLTGIHVLCLVVESHHSSELQLLKELI